MRWWCCQRVPVERYGSLGYCNNKYDFRTPVLQGSFLFNLCTILCLYKTKVHAICYSDFLWDNFWIDIVRNQNVCSKVFHVDSMYVFLLFLFICESAFSCSLFVSKIFIKVKSKQFFLLKRSHFLATLTFWVDLMKRKSQLGKKLFVNRRLMLHYNIFLVNVPTGDLS